MSRILLIPSIEFYNTHDQINIIEMVKRFDQIDITYNQSINDFKTTVNVQSQRIDKTQKKNSEIFQSKKHSNDS